MSYWPAIVERQPASSIDVTAGTIAQVAESPANWQVVSESALLEKLLAARGATANELDFSLAQLPDPAGLVPAAAVDLLLQMRHSRITVVADYDADGATAGAVMTSGLRWLGFSRVTYLVPDRFAEGYGLTPSLVARADAAGADCLVTVDNGIASLAGVEAANKAGMRVLITDHHLPGHELPAADAIVNPRLVTDFAASELAGVGVAFYVLLALRRRLREQKDEAGSVKLAGLLDRVALGTVADVVKLDHYNRILVEQGLRRIRAGACCPGVTALAIVAKREPARLCSADLGFSLGPRLNAAGRLDDMARGIECLLTDNPDMARQYAEELDVINRDRRQIESGMRQEAEKQLAGLNLKGELPAAFSLYSPSWHEGVVGLLASRVKEQTHRPVFAFAASRETGMLKGSGRSIPGIHLRDMLAELAAQEPDLVTKFGGHAMAAGLSLPLDKLSRFRICMNEIVDRHLTEEMFARTVVVDFPLSEADLTLKNAECLTLGTPWGQGFPVPMFLGVFELLSQRIVGEKHVKLTLGLPSVSGVIDGIHFNADLSVWPARDCQSVEGIYRLESNSFRGQVRPQLLFEYLRPV